MAAASGRMAAAPPDEIPGPPELSLIHIFGVIGAKDLHSLQEGGLLILQIRFFPGVQLGDLGLYVLQLLFQPADLLCGSTRIPVSYTHLGRAGQGRKAL